MPFTAFASPMPIYDVYNHTVGETQMDGMKVDIVFADGGSVTKTWGELGSGGIYGVEGGTQGQNDYWRLSYTGTDTQFYTFDWTLTTDRAINNFTIRSLPGNTVFDAVYDAGDNHSTTGSSGGWWEPVGGFINNLPQNNPLISGTVTDPTEAEAIYAVLLGTDYSLTQGRYSYNNTFYWEFRNPAYVIGEAIKYDIFTELYIDFLRPVDPGTAPTGFISTNGVDFHFSVDTDNVSPIPEPASILLFGIGLLGIAGARRERI